VGSQKGRQSTNNTNFRSPWGAALEASGKTIETVGLPLPILRAGRIVVFHLERVESSP
jgi:hypothetical protein